MAAFPDVVLAAPYVGQEAYSADVVQILQIADDVEGKSLKAFTQLGANPSFKYWVPVQSGDDYSVDWTNNDVAVAVEAYFTVSAE
jgi:hypothetical protein